MIINFKKYLCLMFQILHRYADKFYHCLIETLMITSNTSGGVTEMKEALFFLGCIGTSQQKLNPNQELSCWFCCQTICYHIFGTQNVIPVVNATYWQPLLAFLVESCWPPKKMKEEMLGGDWPQLHCQRSQLVQSWELMLFLYSFPHDLLLFAFHNLLARNLME